MSVCPSVILLSFCFRGDNLCKYQLIFTKVDTCMCFDIVKICFRIANGQISTELSVCNRILAGSYHFMFILSGPNCSKLMTLLVNDSLKFTSSETQIC